MQLATQFGYVNQRSQASQDLLANVARSQHQVNQTLLESHEDVEVVMHAYRSELIVAIHVRSCLMSGQSEIARYSQTMREFEYTARHIHKNLHDQCEASSQALRDMTFRLKDSQASVQAQKE